MILFSLGGCFSCILLVLFLFFLNNIFPVLALWPFALNKIDLLIKQKCNDQDHDPSI